MNSGLRTTYLPRLVHGISARHPERSEGSPECGIVLNQGDPSLRSG